MIALMKINNSLVRGKIRVSKIKLN